MHNLYVVVVRTVMPTVNLAISQVIHYLRLALLTRENYF